MIEIEHHRHDDSILIRVTGTVSRKDVDYAVPEIEHALGLADGPLRVMIRLEDFEGWEIGGLWQELKFEMKHRGEFGRVAVIGEGLLEQWGAMLAAPFAGAELRFFPGDREQEARDWLGMAV